MEKLRKSGPLFIIIAAILWSFDGILRTSLYTLPAPVIVFWEHVLGAILLTPFALKSIRTLRTMRKKEWFSILIVSLFSGALGTIFYTSALAKVNYIQFSVVVLLQQLQPVWAILTASVLLKEKITATFVKWAGLAIVASYFVTFRDLRLNTTDGGSTILAAGLAVSAGVMWGVSTSFSKIVLKKVSNLTATYLRFILASLFAFAFVVFFRQTAYINAVSSPQWITLTMITLTTGLVALAIYYYGLKKTPAKVSAICELVWPASAILIDYLYFKRPLSITQIAGTAVVLYSIYKVSSYQENGKAWHRSLVLKGNMVGRTIGFPTVNLDPEVLSGKRNPGVYSCQVRSGGKEYTGALYYGPRHVQNEIKNILEINILDFNKDIYGKEIEFSLAEFIRPARKFNTIEDLKRQIRKDVVEIRQKRVRKQTGE